MTTSIGLIRDTVLLFRDLISGTVVDPVSNRQQLSGDPGSNSRFVMTSFPQRAVVYPFITVQDITQSDVNLGMRTQDSLSSIRMQVDVWTKQIGQRDGMAGSVFHGLRTSQLNNLLGSDYFDLRLVSMTNRDETGKTGVHRKMLEIETSYVNTT